MTDAPTTDIRALPQAINDYLEGRGAGGSGLRAALARAEQVPRRQQSVRGVQTSLLFTDIVESSRAFVRYGEQFGRQLIAIHDDIVGFSVALAARICDAAGPERIFTTGIVGARLREGSAAFRFADQGQLQVKGFEQLVPMYEVQWRA